MSIDKAKLLQPDSKMLLAQLVSLLAVLTIVPLFEQYAANLTVLIAGLTVLFVTGLIINRRYPLILLSGCIMAILALPMMWATLFVNHVGIFVPGCVLGGAFFALTAIVVMWGVLRWFTATVDSVYGALSAYLLLGLAWAMFYWGLDAVDATALNIPHRRTLPVTVGDKELTSFSQLTYFSFVCMSSLGFGDISPRTGIAETLTWLQSVLGQFYLATLVARIVGAIPLLRPKVEDSHAQ